MSPQEVSEYLERLGIKSETVCIVSTALGGSALPDKLPWIEGVDYTVSVVPVQHGLPIRIRDETGESFLTFTETGPDQPPPPPLPIPLTEIGFITLCQEAGGMTDDMLVACDADVHFKAMWIKFRAASQIDKTDARVQQGLSGLAAADYLPNGVDAVNNAWPVK